MYFSSHKLFSLLVLASPGSFTPLGQTLLPLNCHSNAQIKDVEYGYKGPGVYHITGLGDLYNLALGDIGSGDGAPAVVWQSNSTDSQRWFISDVGGGHVAIANNATGVLLSAQTSQAPTRTLFTSPGKLEAQWRLDNYSSAHAPSNAVRLSNAQYTNQILAVYNRVIDVNGTIVYIWPTQGQNNNEGWLLEYLGVH